MLKVLVMAACCMLSMSLSAQFTITGTVKGGSKNEPIAGAEVTLAAGGQSKSIASDKDGRFSLPASSGKYVLTVRRLGFETHTVSLTADGDVTLDIFLQEAPFISDAVIVSATRAGTNTPTSYTNVTKDIAKQNFGQDLPLLLNWTPSLVTTSDAGAGVGYTGLRIRGSDASHINVTINGIPYNDSESQSVYWVDVPDIASSTQSIQVQRGVGTSTNGAGAFGGSVNVETNSLQQQPYAEISNSYGSFNTHKHTLKAGTGLINGVWAFDGRVSKIESDGYIERASANLDSYYLSGGYYGRKTLIKAIMFGGHEVTYQSWYGTDPDMLKIDRRFNYAGAIYDSTGKVQRYYNRQVDDYKQDHYQLHFSHELNDFWSVNAALHFTYGRGYFEEYLQGQTYSGLGLPNPVIGSDTIVAGDFIRRQWLDNKFYGTTYSVHYAKDKINFTAGGALNRYGNAKHWGEIIWAQYAGNIQPGDHYYDALSQKNDFNVYAKLNYDLSEKLNGFIDLQYRQVKYASAGKDDDGNPYSISDIFHFFNPKAGLTYSATDKDAFYASYAVAHREPTRADYLGGTEKPRSEELGNIEAGWKRRTEASSFGVNFYYMDYHDQLVLTGQLNSTGYPIRANVGRSYRTGVELTAMFSLTSQLSWSANVTVSRNKNREFGQVNAEGTPVKYTNTNLILSPNQIVGSQFAWRAQKRTVITLLSKYVGEQYLDNTQRSIVRMNGYFTNDIRISYSITPSFVKEIELAVLFNNVFNTLYSSNGAVYSDVPYFYPQAGRNYLMRMNIRF